MNFFKNHKLYFGALIFIFFCSSSFSLAQLSVINNQIDSIEKILPELKGTKRIDLLIEYSQVLNDQYYWSQSGAIKVKALLNANLAYDLSKKINYLRGLFFSKFLIGHYTTSGKQRKDFFIQIFDIVKESKDYLLIGEASKKIAGNFFTWPKSAIKYYEISISNFKIINKSKELIDVYLRLSRLYKSGGFRPDTSVQDYSMAIFYLNEILNEIEKNKIIMSKLDVLKEFADIYHQMGDYEKASKFFDEAIKIGIEEENYKSLREIYQTIGTREYKLNNYLKANEYFSLVIELFDKKLLQKNTNENIYYRIAYSMRALSYRALKEYKLSNEDFFNSIEIFYDDEDKNYPYKKTIYSEISQNFDSLKFFSESLKYLRLASAMKDSMHKSDQKARLQELQGKYNTERVENENKLLSRDREIQSLALEKQKIETVEKNKSLELLNKENKINEYILIQEKAESEKKNQKLLILDKEGKIKEATINQQTIVRNFLIGGFIFMLTFLTWVLKLHQDKRKANVLLENQKLEIEEKNASLGNAYHVIEEKHHEITDSITYAKRIQQAILPDKSEILRSLPECFVLFKPKDIVSGDFYFFRKEDDKAIIAAVDCTGHGVPGAFMSMIGSERLNDAVQHSTDPGTILSLLNKGVKSSLHQTENIDSTRDGMDLALVSLKLEKNLTFQGSNLKLDKGRFYLEYAGANRPLWIIRKGTKVIEEIKATKTAIGGFTPDDQVFETHKISLTTGDTLYFSTDGFADQFNIYNKKLMSKKFKEVLVSIQDMSMKEQENYLNNFIEEWKGELEQTDDILVIGVRV